MISKLKYVFLSTVVVVLTLVLFFLIYKSSLLVLSALIGVGVACILSPTINYLEDKRKIPRSVGALFIIGGIFLLFFSLFFFAGAVIFEQIDSFQESLPDIINKWQSRWELWAEKYPKMTKALSGQQPMGLAKTTVSYIGLLIASLVSSLTGLTLAAVIALFTIINSKKYFKGLIEVLPVIDKNTLKNKLLLSGTILRKWFSAQFIDMICVGALTSIGLWVAGIKYWALYGLMTAVLSIVPFVGVLIVLLFSAAVVVVLQPEKLIWLGLVFFITQQLEGNFILPKLMNEHVQVPSALLIFLMILVGSWFGVLGVFVTPPLLAIAVALYKDRVIKP